MPATPAARKGNTPRSARAPKSAGTVGISSALGGGKRASDVEENTVAETGSLVAFGLVLALLAYGAFNPDIAKSNAKCVEGTIVKGVRIKCNPDGSRVR